MSELRAYITAGLTDEQIEKIIKAQAPAPTPTPTPTPAPAPAPAPTPANGADPLAEIKTLLNTLVSNQQTANIQTMQQSGEPANAEPEIDALFGLVFDPIENK